MESTYHMNGTKADVAVEIPEMDDFLDILQQGANPHSVDALSSSDSEPEEVTSTAEPYTDPPNLLAARVNAVTRMLSNESPSSRFLRERQLLPTQTAQTPYTAGETNTVIEACLNEMVTAAKELGVARVHIIPSQVAIDTVGHLLASPRFSGRWSPAARLCLQAKLANRARYLIRKHK